MISLPKRYRNKRLSHSPKPDAVISEGEILQLASGFCNCPEFRPTLTSGNRQRALVRYRGHRVSESNDFNLKDVVNEDIGAEGDDKGGNILLFYTVNHALGCLHRGSENLK